MYLRAAVVADVIDAIVVVLDVVIAVAVVVASIVVVDIGSDVVVAAGTRSWQHSFIINSYHL